MNRCLLLALYALASSAGTAHSQQGEWKDPAPHIAKLVTVADSVQLEVLDWGGSGPTIVLLAGLGDTGHVFDDFAPMLTSRYRVIAVTRRGHGRSSAPTSGYEFARLAQDVVRVVDAMGIKKPILIGHSFAGEELHVIGARNAEMIGGLVYVDAAFDRGDDSDNQAYDAVARTLPAAPNAGPSDRASFATLNAFLKKTQGSLVPEAHLRARYLGNADGTVARMWAPDVAVRQAISREMQAQYKPYKPERIHLPALAIYAAPKSVDDMIRPWYPPGDSIRQRASRLYELQRARVENHIKWFQQFAPGARVAEIAGAHHLFVSHPREVVQQIDAFVSSLPADRRP